MEPSSLVSLTSATKIGGKLTSGTGSFWSVHFPDRAFFFFFFSFPLAYWHGMGCVSCEPEAMAYGVAGGTVTMEQTTVSVH